MFRMALGREVFKNDAKLRTRHFHPITDHGEMATFLGDYVKIRQEPLESGTVRLSAAVLVTAGERVLTQRMRPLGKLKICFFDNCGVTFTSNAHSLLVQVVECLHNRIEPILPRTKYRINPLGTMTTGTRHDRVTVNALFHASLQCDSLPDKVQPALRLYAYDEVPEEEICFGWDMRVLELIRNGELLNGVVKSCRHAEPCVGV